MARRPNYAFEKNARAKAKAAKREAKRQAKLAAKAGAEPVDPATGTDDAAPPTATTSDESPRDET